MGPLEGEGQDPLTLSMEGHVKIGVHRDYRRRPHVLVEVQKYEAKCLHLEVGRLNKLIQWLQIQDGSPPAVFLRTRKNEVIAFAGLSDRRTIAPLASEDCISSRRRPRRAGSSGRGVGR